MFKKDRNLEERVRQIEDEITEFRDYLTLCINNLPRKEKEKQVASFLSVSFKDCPHFVKYIFQELYNAYNNGVDISIQIGINDDWVKIGTVEDTLEKLINNYLLEHEKRGSLFLSCPNCQERFLLECNTSEDYSHVCQKCGKYLKLKVTSRNISITVS